MNSQKPIFINYTLYYCLGKSVIANNDHKLLDPCLTGLHNSHVLSSHHPLHSSSHCNPPTSSSKHQHFVMLFGKGSTACVKLRDADGVALPQTTQCSHSVSEQKVILVSNIWASNKTKSVNKPHSPCFLLHVCSLTI